MNNENPIFENRNFKELFTLVTKETEEIIPFWSEAWERVDERGKVYKHKFGEDKSKISGYMSINFQPEKNYKTLYVKPSVEVIEVIKTHMLIINYDTIYFKVIVFDNKVTRIWAEYNQIIGSLFLGEFDYSDMIE